MERSRYTPSQLLAIDHVAGNLQLIACAGSSKTEAVAKPVVSLLRPIADGGAGCIPENIVAFTFTDKAAADRGAMIAGKTSTLTFRIRPPLNDAHSAASEHGDRHGRANNNREPS